MARNYRRDSRGRFAKTGAVRRAIKAIQGRGVRKRHEKLLKQGYVPTTTVYMGDIKGRKIQGGKYKHIVTEYRKPK